MEPKVIAAIAGVIAVIATVTIVAVVVANSGDDGENNVELAAFQVICDADASGLEFFSCANDQLFLCAEGKQVEAIDLNEEICGIEGEAAQLCPCGEGVKYSLAETDNAETVQAGVCNFAQQVIDDAFNGCGGDFPPINDALVAFEAVCDADESGQQFFSCEADQLFFCATGNVVESIALDAEICAIEGEPARFCPCTPGVKYGAQAVDNAGTIQTGVCTFAQQDADGEFNGCAAVFPPIA